LLEGILFVSLLFPFLVPFINKLWRRALFESKSEKIDRSDQVFNINCLFKQHVDEWAIPVSVLPQALEELRSSMESKGFKAHFPIEVRFVAGDDIYLSPAYGRATAYVGIIAYKPYGYESNYKEYFADYERIMAAYQGRPHWAKDFGFRGDADFEPAYPDTWKLFKQIRSEVDPSGVFANAWVKRTLGLSDNNTEENGGEEEDGAGGGGAGGAGAVPVPNSTTATTTSNKNSKNKFHKEFKTSGNNEKNFGVGMVSVCDIHRVSSASLEQQQQQQQQQQQRGDDLEGVLAQMSFAIAR
jgi:hypothetical protein